MERESAGIYSRKYVKKTDVVLCKHCLKDRRLPGHQQYFGNWYCEETATVPLSEWRQQLVAKGYGKRKGRAATESGKEGDGEEGREMI